MRSASGRRNAFEQSGQARQWVKIKRPASDEESPLAAKILKRNRLLLLGLLRLQAGVSSGCELRLELLDTAGGVDVLQLAGIKRMASVANVDLQFLAGATRDKGIAAATCDLGFVILRMYVAFHDLKLHLKFKISVLVGRIPNFTQASIGSQGQKPLSKLVDFSSTEIAFPA